MFFSTDDCIYYRISLMQILGIIFFIKNELVYEFKKEPKNIDTFSQSLIYFLLSTFLKCNLDHHFSFFKV